MKWRGAGILCLLPALTGQPSDDAVFRTSIKLVQVDVLAHDRAGKPVADLRREEFQIFDNGKPQQVALFLLDAATLKSGVQSAAPANTFRNTVSTPPAYTVILLDNLFTDADYPINTDEEGTALARVRTLEMLRSLPAGDKIAIYAQRRKLDVIAEFTADRDLLESRLRGWAPSPDTPTNAGRAFSGGGAITIAPGMNGNVAAEAARIDSLQRASAAEEQMDQLAAHLSSIPGRKNLIWLSNRFVTGSRGVPKLAAAGVAIYPVDLDGVCRVCPERPKQLMDAIAGATGGVAYYSRNDLALAMREAMEDSRVRYTLGFYQPDADQDSRLHRIEVRSSRADVTLRYQMSFQAAPVSKRQSSLQDLIQALRQPVDSPAIPITASFTRSSDTLDLNASFDLAALDLELRDEVWTGQAEVVARFTAADGTQAGQVISETTKFRLQPHTYASMLESGAPYRKQLKIPAKAVELRILVGKLDTGKTGTLTIPLTRIQ